MVARFVVLLVALAALALAAVERLAEDAAARGFFDEGIAWVPLTKGKALAKELQKPMVLCAKANGGLTMPAAQLVLVHSSSCGACLNLKKQLGSKSGDRDKLEAMQDKFVMVNLQDAEASGLKLFETGGYVPRIFFVDDDGESLLDVKGPNAQYPLFFASPGQMAEGMEQALELFTPGDKSEL